MSDNSEKKPIYKKWWFWLIIVIIVIAIAGGSTNNNSTPTSSPTTSSTTNLATSSEEKETEQNETTIVSAGEEISTSDTKISFVSVEDYKGYDSYSEPKTGNKIIRAEFVFENISNSDIYLNGFDCYADGEKCEEYYYADDYKNPTLESLSSGKKITAVVYYEVPTDAEDILLEYETNAWTNNKIEFKIK